MRNEKIREKETPLGRERKPGACAKHGRRIPHPKIAAMVTVLMLAAVGAVIAFDIPCLFLRLFGIPCPLCGMTRSVLCALRLDFVGAFRFHPMFWALPYCYWCFLTELAPTGNRRLDQIGIGTVAGLFAISYAVRLISL